MRTDANVASMQNRKERISKTFLFLLRNKTRCPLVLVPKALGSFLEISTQPVIDTT